MKCKLSKGIVSETGAVIIGFGAALIIHNNERGKGLELTLMLFGAYVAIEVMLKGESR